MVLRTLARWAALAALTAGLVAALPAPAASAGEGPYGPTTTTAAPPPQGAEAGCELSLEAGTPGDTGTATVSGVEAGQTVRLLFGGVEGGRGQAPADAADGRGAVVVAFTVPALDEGRYLVTAVSATFTVECGAGFTIGAVLGSVVEPSADQQLGPLPKTGVYAGVLVAIAIALLVLGRSLLAESRRRRRRAWAEANRVERLVAPPGPTH